MDYLDWTGKATAPAGLGRVLEVASIRVDELLVGAVYPVDAVGNPTDLDVKMVLRNATCEQALYMLELGDTSGAKAGMKSMTIGRIQWQRAEPKTGSPGSSEKYAPAVLDMLHVFGLRPTSVIRLP